MKIAYCLPSLYIPGGMERVLTIKANYFADIFNYEVYIILTDGKEKKIFYDLSPKIHVIHLDINFDHLLGQAFLEKAMIYIYKQKCYKSKLKKVLQEIKPDITVSMLRREINFINSICDGSIKIGEIHINKDHFRNFEGKEATNPVKKAFSNLWMSQLIRELKKLDQFVVLTEEDKNKWSELQNVKVIPNPLPFFPEQTSDCKSHQVLAVGRYVYEKGFDMLIQAWSLISSKHPDWILRIYGDGNQEPYCKQIYRHHIEKTCLLEHSVPNIVDKYTESSIFVLSSRFEGFGMVITEAMSCGLPVVSFACPYGPRAIIEEGVDGFLVEPENIKSLSEKMNFLMEHEEKRIQMGQMARQNSKRFRIEKIADQWKTLFLDLLSTQEPH
jgi:glycosyltransferase involved in cell wall biosynthesis